MTRHLSRASPARTALTGLALAALTVLLLADPAHAEAPVAAAGPAATLDEVLAIARQLGPELAARALDTEAAQARVAIAGALPDPTVRITSDEIDRTAGPRQNKMIYSFEQEFPLWGKRDLRSAQASALVERSRADARQTEAELIEKVKIAFAQYYQSDQAIRTTQDLHRVVHDIAKVARDRYAQGAVRSRRRTRANSKTHGFRRRLSVSKRPGKVRRRGSMRCSPGRSTRRSRGRCGCGRCRRLQHSPRPL